MKFRLSLKSCAVSGIFSIGLAFAGTASAALIQFSAIDHTSSAGYLEKEVGRLPIFGEALDMEQISLVGDDGLRSSLICDGCELNFTTGLVSGGSATDATFNSLGSSFTITGNAYEIDPDSTMPGQQIASGALLTGHFSGTQNLELGGTSAGDSVSLRGHGIDMLSSPLLQYFGASTALDTVFDAFLQGSLNLYNENGTFEATVRNAIVNTVVNIDDVAAPVPAPGGWFVFCLGSPALLLGLYRRKRITAFGAVRAPGEFTHF